MVYIPENIKPICKVERVGRADTIYDVPGIVTLEPAFKRCISYMTSFEQCSFDEILDAYRKRKIARKKSGICIDRLPPTDVSRISDGGDVRPQKELFRMIKKKMLSFVGKINGNLIFTL
ncbi:hypothetical protein DCAR_0519191 [Daucus carota subsp. sativus]|uniref:Uncharacterized protein n=1 Tax=Daucus carota subsp. sativus TaxID=79200 RepID=A0AAF0X4Z7_DAUCS|nr:hypothetical protein DCAR_0519191 [Daucus carota subsp. sativus]